MLSHFNSRVAKSSNAGRFVALGVSEDNRMGNDLAFVCQSFPSENVTKEPFRANTKVTYDFLEILITSFILNMNSSRVLVHLSFNISIFRFK